MFTLICSNYFQGASVHFPPALGCSVARSSYSETKMELLRTQDRSTAHSRELFVKQ